VIVETPKYIVNSLLYSGLAVALCIVVGVPIAWLLARTRVPGRDTLDALNTLILAIPGTAIGIAYIRAFQRRGSRLDRALTSFWADHPIVLACAGSRTPCGAPTPRCCSSTARWKRRRPAWARPGCAPSVTSRCR